MTYKAIDQYKKEFDFYVSKGEARLTSHTIVTIDEALEKQIPKKPVDLDNCPNCGKRVEGKREHINFYECDFTPYPYCPNCGQAIDWSKDNE